ncbi:MAG: ehrA-2 [Deltaproteobacteria bacterium]|nr:ehrA-2 [Deltaproteobacteria bacterium]
MLLLLSATGLFVLSGLAALLAQKSDRWCTGLGAGGAVVGCLLGLVPTLPVVVGSPGFSLRWAWDVPYGAFAVEVDALSAFFLLPIFVVCALAAVYGAEYLIPFRRQKPLGPAWLSYNVLIASMVLVVVARNAVLFLVAWEVMAMASFFLVTFEDEQESVRGAGWVYLVASHLGTACLLALFVLLGRASGSLDFDHLNAASSPAGLLFGLAVVGFGTKAGFMPLHVWLPEAHPAAPSHVSAVMSGVMIKTGIYGLMRTLTLLGPPPAWWGWVLCGIGLTSGILGVLFALAQHDLKRLLAYHSVENIGIIALGLGLGVVGISTGSGPLAVLGFAGALLHVLNHAIFKGLLFLGAGAVAHATGTREIDHLGGLLKQAPWTGLSFLVGAVAISGLPPLNGFVSEFLIYLGAFRGVTTGDRAAVVVALGVIAALALIGGLAAACFTKAFGIVFLGEPRTHHATHVHEPGLPMRVPMLLLAAACVVIGCLAPVVVRWLAPVVGRATGLPLETVRGGLAGATGPLTFLTAIAAGLIILTAVLAGLRRWLLSGRRVETSGTWDCGYAQPGPRMQYTASSFAQLLTDLFRPLLQVQQRVELPEGLFPSHGSFSSETPDRCTTRIYGPLFSAIDRGLAALRWLQHGEVHLYILYIALTLLVLLIWKLGTL